MNKVENHPNLMRTNTGLIVDVDKSGYNRYMAQKNNNNKVNELETEINTLKEDIGEIKSLLHALINKGL